jgi:hypothetical protein
MVIRHGPEGTIVNKLAVAAVLALFTCAAAQAAVIDLGSNDSLARPPGVMQSGPGDLAVNGPALIVVPPRGMSELAEPEMFAMMLLGLCLIGYRANRDSDEKFE